MYVRVEGVQVSSAEAPILVIAPHSTFLDGVLIFMLNYCPAVIAKYETYNTPFMGSK